MAARCKGQIVGDFRRGSPCRYHAARDGYCARHHPDQLLPAARTQVAALRAELRNAERRLANLICESAFFRSRATKPVALAPPQVATRRKTASVR